MSELHALLRATLAGFRVLVALTLLVGVIYPLTVTLVAQSAFGWQANGSLLTSTGSRTERVPDAVGSALLGQPATADDQFAPRPSAAGDGYDPRASGGSNLGPENPELVAQVEQRRRDVAAREGVDPDQVPPDALTASASGLDPHISPEYAALQVGRVARASGLDPEQVRGLVARHTSGRGAGVLGEPRVTVLSLNLAVRQLAGS